MFSAVPKFLDASPTWKAFRHAKAAGDLLQWLGVWKLVATAIGAVAAYSAGFPIWARLLIGLSTLVLTPIALLAWKIFREPKPNPTDGTETESVTAGPIAEPKGQWKSRIQVATIFGAVILAGVMSQPKPDSAITLKKASIVGTPPPVKATAEPLPAARPQAAPKAKPPEVGVERHVRAEPLRTATPPTFGTINLAPCSGGVNIGGQGNTANGGNCVPDPNAGVVSYDFNGDKRISTHGGNHVNIVEGPEHDAFIAMATLEKRRDWTALNEEAEKWTKQTPEWLVPRLLSGRALAEMGQKTKACAHLKYVESKTKDNSEYDGARKMFNQLGCP